MKKIVIISSIVAPLLAGCANGSLEPGARTNSSTDMKRLQARELASVRSQLHKLKGRVRALNRKVDTRSNPTSTLSRHESAALNDVTSRVADLEAALRTREPNSPDSGKSQTVASIGERLEELSRKVERQAEKKPDAATSNPQAKQDQIIQRISILETRLKQLAAASQTKAPSRSGDTAALKTLVDRLAKTETAQKSTSGKIDQMASELDKDRALLLDYLEDLDQRITNLEKPATAAPPVGTKP